MNHWKQALPALTAAVLTAVAPMQALAATPHFARTEEEWARLQDDTIEYSELADLIEEYNVTVQNNKLDYEQFKKDYGTTKDDVARSYRDLADELYNNMSGDDDASSMISDLSIETQAESLRETADDNVEDSQVMWLQYEQARDNLVVVAQSNMISYKTDLINQELQEANLKVLENTYRLAEAQKAAGTGTEMDVLNAEESLLNARQSLESTESSITSMRQKLNVMLGWKNTDNPEIGDIPQPDLEKIAAMDPAADKAKALENNYTLLINKRKLENAEAASTKETLQNTIRENEQQIGVSLQTAYQNVLSAKIAWEQAVAAEALETKNMVLADAKNQAGMITAMEYEQQQYTLLSKQIAVKTTAIDLFEATESYEWAVNGLADAGS